MYKSRLTVQLSVCITVSDVNCEIFAPKSNITFLVYQHNMKKFRLLCVSAFSHYA